MIWTTIKTIFWVVVIGGGIWLSYMVCTAPEIVYDVTVYVTYQDGSTEIVKSTKVGVPSSYSLTGGCIKPWHTGGYGSAIRCGVKKFSYTVYRKKDLEVSN